MILFEKLTPLGVLINITDDYWKYIIEIKHRIMADKLEIVKQILENPDEIRKSRYANDIYLYYKKYDKIYCVVAKHRNNIEGFVITTYPTDKIKEGEIIWKK